MQIAQKENEPVIYNADATKILHFARSAGKVCFQLHWHERLEILYIRKGSMFYICGNKKGIVSAGQALVVPPRMAHYGRVHTDAAYDVLMFDLRNFYNQSQVCKKTLTAFFEGAAEFDTVITEPKTLGCIAELCQSATPDSLLAVAQVYMLLHLMLTEGLVKISPKPRDDGIREITDYIEEHFCENLTTANLSETFGYTPAYFCRKFKKAIGLTPLNYIKIYRLEQAQKRIERGQGRISEIAEQCGFSDPNYFTRCFTAYYGNPPTEYKPKKI